jgi:hypothetical protein
LLVDNGGSILHLKRLGGWASTSSAEGYIAESLTNKIQTSKKIFSALNHQQNISNHHSPPPTLMEKMEKQQLDLEQRSSSTSSVNISMNNFFSRATSSALFFK